MGPVANHDAAIAAIETAFSEFEEEKADIYEMGKIAKVSDCKTDNTWFNKRFQKVSVNMKLQ